MENEFNEYIIDHMDKAIISCVDDLTNLETAVKQLEEIINIYKSIKLKFKENKLEELTEQEKQLATRIGAVIIKDEFYDNIKNTVSKAKIVVRKNKALKDKASNFGNYFTEKFKI